MPNRRVRQPLPFFGQVSVKMADMKGRKAIITVCIVTPALADANNGNWQTARRWAHQLSKEYRVRLVQSWPDSPDQAMHDDVLLALHARRSAASIDAWHLKHPRRCLIVALTGTDLYRDIETDMQAQASLRNAQRLIVLQEDGLQSLPPTWRSKARVVYQSSTARQPLTKTRRWLNVVVAGHLREEKSPQTVFDIARRLKPEDGIRIAHLGLGLDPTLAEAAAETARLCPHYRWLGGVTHAQARSRIQRAHLLLHPSRMEGGAHVIMEAVTSGTAVVASRVSGNVGMLGADYAGYFPWGDAQVATQLLRACHDSLKGPGNAHADLWSTLHAQCDQRAVLFLPETEAHALRTVLADVLNDPTPC